MYSLRLTCEAQEVDHLSGELWQAETQGIQEVEHGDGVLLIAAFASNERRAALLRRFASFRPRWGHEEAIDWVRETQASWPAREVGEKLFLAPPWSTDASPRGRQRVIHNPGLACGTGEHPCTQLALIALEQCVKPGFQVVDVGTGSGILAIAALHLGAKLAVGLDIDEAALQSARENFRLNNFSGDLSAGTADCLAAGFADVVVANISATVLLDLLDELLRITRPDGSLVLTGFAAAELPGIQNNLSNTTVLEMNEWRCVIARPC